MWCLSELLVVGLQLTVRLARTASVTALYLKTTRLPILKFAANLETIRMSGVLAPVGRSALS